MSQPMPASDPQFQALARERYAGDPRALGELGARLIVGREAPRAPIDGAALIEEAVRRGDAAAWRHAALLAAAGVVRAQSWRDALDALGHAADGGDHDAGEQIELLRAMGIRGAQDATAWIAAVRPRELHAAPRLVTIRDFLTPRLSTYLIERARPQLVPARVNDASGGGLKLDPMRTNTCAVFSFIDTGVVFHLVRARIAHVAAVDIAALEPPEVLHYAVGETYRPHVDFFHPALPTFAREMKEKGQRVRTCLVYLNDDYGGGETEFPKLGIKFRGHVGEALIFDNVGANGAGDLKTLHTGLAPRRGEKWLLSQWMRNKAQQLR